MIKYKREKMSKVEIYYRVGCDFCDRAIGLLDKKNVDYTTYDIWSDKAIFEQMLKRSNGGRTVPQVFINDQHIGGCDDMMALERQGKLDSLLQSD